MGSIEDDGKGFDAAQALDVEGGRVDWGLVGVRERIEALGAPLPSSRRPRATPRSCGGCH